jgi:protein SDA1
MRICRSTVSGTRCDGDKGSRLTMTTLHAVADKMYTLEHKITIMQLLSRVMGAHKLCVLGFYTYIIKYLTYHQLQVTQILVSLAQSVHDLTPPDVLVPIIHKLAHEFVHPGVGAEVIAAGINSIREVSRRQPWCMEGEEDLLSDLIEYRKSKDKGVTTAARGLLQLFREVNPGLLKRRERGKAATLGLLDGQVPAFGHGQDAADGIDGLELLDEHFAQSRAEQGLDPDAPVDEREQEAEDAAAWQKWEEDEEEGDSDSDSSGWEVVSSDSDNDISFSDSDDDEEEKARRNEKKRDKKNGKDKSKAKGDEDEEMDEAEEAGGDDAKSVLSEAAPSIAGTEAELKKMSLLAQQKVRPITIMKSLRDPESS